MNLYDAIFVKMTAKSDKMGPVPSNLLNQILSFANYTALIWNESSIAYEIWSYEEKKKLIDRHLSFKAPHYFVATVEDDPERVISLGFFMEQIRLYLITKQIGSFFVGFQKLNEVSENGKVKFRVVLAFGNVVFDPVRSSSKIRRLELKDLCVFKEDVSIEMVTLLNAARLTPSYSNSQPWRFVVMNNRIHVFCKKDRFSTKMQTRYDYYDMGSMLAHLVIAGEELWFNLEISKKEEIAEKELKNNTYMFSVLLSEQI